MTFSVTARDAPTTAAEKSDQPLLRAATGLSCRSDSVGALADDSANDGCEAPGGGVGVFPNPWYRPP